MIYNADNCHSDICKFSKPYFGTSATNAIGKTCEFSENKNLILPGSKCLLSLKTVVIENQLSQRFDKTKCK